MPPQLPFPTFIPTPAAASAVPLCQIHYGVPANACLAPGEDIAEQGKISSDDCHQSDFLLEGPWFSGYHTQIANNGCNGSVLPHDSVPSPIAGSVNGAEGNFPVTYPNLLGGHPEHRYFGDGDNTVINPISLVDPAPTLNMQQPPRGFPLDTHQNPIPSQVPADDRRPCGWRGEHGDTCNVLIGYRCEAHLASAHGIVGMSRTRTVECGRCGKRIGRRSILRHYREKHLGFHRQWKGDVFHDTRE